MKLQASDRGHKPIKKVFEVINEESSTSLQRSRPLMATGKNAGSALPSLFRPGDFSLLSYSHIYKNCFRIWTSSPQPNRAEQLLDAARAWRTEAVTQPTPEPHTHQGGGSGVAADPNTRLFSIITNKQFLSVTFHCFSVNLPDDIISLS